MSIIRSNSDNKILRSTSGEILTKSDALIDLRSTFGVTKDVSNNVSKVKLFNNPSQVFRAPSGNEPTENGDGFEFGGVNDYMIKSNPNINYKNGFTLTVWVKVSDLTGDRRIISIRDSNVSNREFILRFNNDNLFLSIFKDGINTIENITSALSAVNWIDIWRNVGFGCQYISGTNYYWCLFIDGIMLGKTTISVQDRQQITPLVIGVRYPENDNGFNGNVDDAIISAGYDLASLSNNDQVFTPKPRSSE
jgi:hypothetical protein